jgi:hypothetical protein
MKIESDKKERFKLARVFEICFFLSLVGFTLIMAIRDEDTRVQGSNVPPPQKYKMHDLIYPVTDYELEDVASVRESQTKMCNFCHQEIIHCV